MKFSYIYLSIIILGLIISCNHSYDKGFKRKLLTELEIRELLNKLDNQHDSLENFHIQYTESFNDSTDLLFIWRNSKKPTEDLKVCGLMTYMGSTVFLYEDHCNSLIPAVYKSKDGQSPFFIPDSEFWRILVMRRKGEINYYRVSIFITEGIGTDDL